MMQDGGQNGHLNLMASDSKSLSKCIFVKFLSKQYKQRDANLHHIMNDRI